MCPAYKLDDRVSPVVLSCLSGPRNRRSRARHDGTSSVLLIKFHSRPTPRHSRVMRPNCILQCSSEPTPAESSPFRRQPTRRFRRISRASFDPLLRFARGKLKKDTSVAIVMYPRYKISCLNIGRYAAGVTANGEGSGE